MGITGMILLMTLAFVFIINQTRKGGILNYKDGGNGAMGMGNIGDLGFGKVRKENGRRGRWERVN